MALLARNQTKSQKFQTCFSQDWNNFLNFFKMLFEARLKGLLYEISLNPALSEKQDVPASKAHRSTICKISVYFTGCTLVIANVLKSGIDFFPKTTFLTNL